MRYLGGKTQISKDLAAAVNAHRPTGWPVWDAFCGSLAMACALGGPGVASDICGPLITMYQAIDAGWQPPTTFSKDEWAAAKLLPDSDPLKAFAGFGCSFRGLWFKGYAGGYIGPNSGFGAQAAAKVLVRDVARVRAAGFQIALLSFFDIAPKPGFLLYLDPPYADTAAYAAVAAFCSAAFWTRAQAWADAGSIVLVSEEAAPIGRCVWQRVRRSKLRTGSNRVEKLFLVSPKQNAPEPTSSGAYRPTNQTEEEI